MFILYSESGEPIERFDTFSDAFNAATEAGFTIRGKVWVGIKDKCLGTLFDAQGHALGIFERNSHDHST